MKFNEGTNQKDFRKSRREMHLKGSKKILANSCLPTRAKRERSVVGVSEANGEVFLLPKNPIGAVVFGCLFYHT